MGSISRTRGHNFERRVALMLTEWAGVKAISTRALKSTQKHIPEYPHPCGDVVLPVPWEVIFECKKGYHEFRLIYPESIAHLEEWITQAKSETPGGWNWFLVYSRNNSKSTTIIMDSGLFKHLLANNTNLHMLSRVTVRSENYRYRVTVLDYQLFFNAFRPSQLNRLMKEFKR